MAELLLRRWIHLWELRCEHSIEEVLEGCWPSLLRVLSLSNRTTQCFTWDGYFKNEESGCWKVRVICDCLRCSWLWDVCGSIGDFLSLCTVGTRWKLELSCHNTQGPGTLGPVCQPLGSVLVSYILPLLPLVRWCSWSVNPLETWPLLCNLVKTARQHCHLSEEKRMQVCFAKSYIHVKGTLASSCGGQWGEGVLICLSKDLVRYWMGLQGQVYQSKPSLWDAAQREDDSSQFLPPWTGVVLGSPRQTLELLRMPIAASFPPPL